MAVSVFSLGVSAGGVSARGVRACVWRRGRFRAARGHSMRRTPRGQRASSELIRASPAEDRHSPVPRRAQTVARCGGGSCARASRTRGGFHPRLPDRARSVRVSGGRRDCSAGSTGGGRDRSKPSAVRVRPSPNLRWLQRCTLPEVVEAFSARRPSRSCTVANETASAVIRKHQWLQSGSRDAHE